jgi:hypothetical protein
LKPSGYSKASAIILALRYTLRTDGCWTWWCGMIVKRRMA